MSDVVTISNKVIFANPLQGAILPIVSGTTEGKLNLPTLTRKGSILFGMGAGVGNTSFDNSNVSTSIIASLSNPNINNNFTFSNAPAIGLVEIEDIASTNQISSSTFSFSISSKVASATGNLSASSTALFLLQFQDTNTLGFSLGVDDNTQVLGTCNTGTQLFVLCAAKSANNSMNCQITIPEMTSNTTVSVLAQCTIAGTLQKSINVVSSPAPQE